jgi:hypothetical protein
VSAAGPLRGPGEDKGRRRFRRHSSPGAPPGYGAAPPASRVLRIALARDSPAGCPGPRRPRRPLEAGRAGRPRACPGQARRAGPAVAGGCGYPDAGERSELAFDNQKEEGKITQIQVRAPGPVASSQQSHLAKLLHTEPGVHETRDAPRCAPYCMTSQPPTHTSVTRRTGRSGASSAGLGRIRQPKISIDLRGSERYR